MSNISRSTEHYDAKARHWSVLVAYSSGMLSEGIACKILAIDRVRLREHIQDAERAASELHERYRLGKTTVADDFAEEAVINASCRCRCSD